MEYTGRDILDIEELEIYSYDRIGLVGDNGAGKTSLLKILSGNLTIADADVRRFGSIALIGQLDELDLDAAQDSGEMLSRLNVAGVAQETMSGGEETRAKIASALSQHASAIFADEPTSHLDQDGISLLVGQLKAFDGALLTVSHDRYFLDQVVDKIWELKDGGISEFWGDCSDYLRQKEEERKVQAARYEEAMRERERLEAAIEKQRKKARQVDAKQKGTKKSDENAGRLGHQKATGTKQKRMYQAAKNMEKRLEALKGIEAPDSIRTVRFRQSKALELHSKFPISADDFSLSFGDCMLYDHAKFEIPLGAKVAITGGNGTGKTSLLKAIARRADGINISPKAEIGYFEQTGYKFDSRQSAISFMQDGCEYSMTELRSILASMGIGPRDPTKDVGILSGGEVIKLLLAKMLLGRYNILLMDEPGNYLDIKSAEALEQMMSAYAGTIVFVSHDKRLGRERRRHYLRNKGHQASQNLSARIILNEQDIFPEWRQKASKQAFFSAMHRSIDKVHRNSEELAIRVFRDTKEIFIAGKRMNQANLIVARIERARQDRGISVAELARLSDSTPGCISASLRSARESSSTTSEVSMSFALR